MLRRQCVAGLAGLIPLGYVSLFQTTGAWADADSKPISSLEDLVDRVIDVELVDETYLADVTLVELVKDGGAISAILVRSDANPRRIAAKEIAELYVDGEPCDVRVAPESRGLEISAKKRAERVRTEEETTARLASRKQKPWPRATAALQAQAMREHEEHLSQVRKVFPARMFDVEQSRYYILCSDLAPLETRQILAALDRLYDTLCDPDRKERLVRQVHCPCVP